jgi:hypothetical protein
MAALSKARNIFTRSNSEMGRAIAQAVSRWLPTAAVRGSSPGLVMWDFVVDKVALVQVFSEYFGFPCQSSFHQLLQKSSSFIIWGLSNRPKAAAVPRDLSRYLGTQSHPTNNNKNINSEIVASNPTRGINVCLRFF